MVSLCPENLLTTRTKLHKNDAIILTFGVSSTVDFTLKQHKQEDSAATSVKYQTKKNNNFIYICHPRIQNPMKLSKNEVKLKT